jgi:hypothetical protein
MARPRRHAKKGSDEDDIGEKDSAMRDDADDADKDDDSDNAETKEKDDDEQLQVADTASKDLNKRKAVANAKPERKKRRRVDQIDPPERGSKAYHKMKSSRISGLRKKIAELYSLLGLEAILVVESSSGPDIYPDVIVNEKTGRLRQWFNNPVVQKQLQNIPPATTPIFDPSANLQRKRSAVAAAFKALKIRPQKHIPEDFPPADQVRRPYQNNLLNGVECDRLLSYIESKGSGLDKSFIPAKLPTKPQLQLPAPADSSDTEMSVESSVYRESQHANSDTKAGNSTDSDKSKAVAKEKQKQTKAKSKSKKPAVASTTIQIGFRSGVALFKSGLRNELRTDCFMNSMLQLLFGMPRFINLLEELRYGLSSRCCVIDVTASCMTPLHDQRETHWRSLWLERKFWQCGTSSQTVKLYTPLNLFGCFWAISTKECTTATKYSHER